MKVSRVTTVDIDVDNMILGDKVEIDLGELGTTTATVQEVNNTNVVLMADKCITCKSINNNKIENKAEDIAEHNTEHKINNKAKNSIEYKAKDFRDTDIYHWLNGYLLGQIQEDLKKDLRYITLPTFGQIYGFGRFPFDVDVEPDSNDVFPLIREELEKSGIVNFWLRNTSYTSFDGEDEGRFIAACSKDQISSLPSTNKSGIRPVFILNKIHKNIRNKDIEDIDIKVNLEENIKSDINTDIKENIKENTDVDTDTKENFKYYFRWLKRFIDGINSLECSRQLTAFSTILSRIDTKEDYTLKLEHIEVSYSSNKTVLQKLINNKDIKGNEKDPFLIKCSEKVYKINPNIIEKANKKISLSNRDKMVNFMKYLEWFSEIKKSFDDIMSVQQRIVIYLFMNMDEECRIKASHIDIKKACGVALPTIRKTLRHLQNGLDPIYVGNDDYGDPLYTYPTSDYFPFLEKIYKDHYTVFLYAIKKFY